jgi:hypothetical protein
MNNFFKITIILSMIGVASIATAQDASNPATWDQTIKYINENKSKIHGESQVYKSTDNFTFNMDSETMELVFPKDGYYITVTFPLDQLENASTVYPKTFLEFNWRPGSRKKFMGNYEENSNKEPEYDVSEHMWIIYIEDDPDKKMTKAFQHLAYLATSKRED